MFLNVVWSDYVTLVNANDWRPDWFESVMGCHDIDLAFYNNVSIYPSKMDKKTRSVTFNVYDENRSPILACNYVRGRSGNVFSYVKTLNKEPDRNFDRVGKPVIYLGWLHPHYGHFLTESLSRLWALKYLEKNLLESCYFYFDIHTPIDSVINKSWIRKILAIFGVDEKNLIFGNKSYLIDSFIVPTQALVLHSYVNSELQNYIWDSISRANSSSLTKHDKKIYLSRSKLVKDKRKLLNEIQVETALSKIGFEIIYPELLSFEEQLEKYKSASLLVGASGSALHNAVFMNSNTHVVSLSTRDFSLLNELLCCFARNIKYSLFISDGISTDKWSVNVDKLVEYLKTC
jgi:capsular polysaccharide biosynthesis protein